MTEEQFIDFCEDTKVGDTFTLMNGDRRMLIRGENYALLDPDSGHVTTQWYEMKNELLEKFKGKVA